jgi:hypothetical protein
MNASEMMKIKLIFGGEVSKIILTVYKTPSNWDVMQVQAFLVADFSTPQIPYNTETETFLLVNLITSHRVMSIKS